MNNELDLAYMDTVIPGVKVLKLGAPIGVQYEITSKCNYRCRFCYNVWKHGSNRVERSPLPFDQKVKVLEKVIGLEVFGVMFSGGEPLLEKDLFLLLKMCREAKIQTSVITNGSMLSEKVCHQLAESGLDFLQISLHGSNAGMNDWMTRQKNSFNLTVTGIKNALKILDKKIININMVATSANYADLYATAALTASLGVKHFSFSALSFTGDALTNNLSLSHDEFRATFSELLRVRENLGVEVSVVGGYPFCTLTSIHPEPWQFSSNLCDAGINQFVIAPNGDMRPCVCFPQTVGNILTDDPRNVWQKADFFRALRKLEHVPPACYSCKHVSACKGGCRASAFCSSGDLQAFEPLGGPQ